VPTPLILDVDTGIDDMLALLSVAGDPDAELLAVTCSAGNATLDDTQRNTRIVLELAGRADVEVAAGRQVPLVRALEVTPETHGPRGLGYADPPDPRMPLSSRFAADVIVEAARRRPGEVTLVTLGPLTNLAVALELEPGLPGLLGRWVMMGGAFRVPGNTTAVSEWNVHCDPEAAKACFAAWTTAIRADPSIARMTAMGLDVTGHAVIGPPELEALAARAAGNPALQRTIVDALRFYFEFHEQYDGFYGAHIHDPLVAACALDLSLITASEPASIDVDTSGGAEDGRTIADWTSPTPNADVVLDADVAGFVRRLLEGRNRGPSRAPHRAAALSSPPGPAAPPGRSRAPRARG
jgi:purine nucleosidase